jgi:glycine/D-amino acid oxidase-like deaminating enzyme
MKYDYIIVGCGLAGIAFAETAIQNGKSVFVINNKSQNSSIIAAGLYNPVILKRFTEVWQAKEQLKYLDEFYSSLQLKLNCQLDYKIPLLRKFHSVEEQNNWFIASDKPNLSYHLSAKLIFEKFTAIPANYGFGEVKNTGFVDTTMLVSKYIDYLKTNKSYLESDFDYSNLKQSQNCIEYLNTKANHIIFAEGFGILSNPFFNKLPLDGAKGELLIIKSSNLKLEIIIKTNIFIIPLGNDLYKVGATYNWEDKTSIPTEAAKQELIAELKNTISCDFEVINHFAGVRPTVKDRKPMLGSHPEFKNFHLLNGLGTRGVMLAPSLANMLYNAIEKNTPIPEEVDIKRFKKIYPNLYQNSQTY